MKNGWRVLLTFFAVVLAGNLLAISLVPIRASSHRYLKMYRYQMALMEPDVVLVGNSMLGAAVEETVLSLMTGRTALKIQKGGSASAAWFLKIKNVALWPPKKPEMVVLFFRDQFLTYPGYRIGGKYSGYIRDLSIGPEPLLKQLAFKKKSNLELYASLYLPIFRRRDMIEQKLNRRMKIISGSTGQIDAKTLPEKRADQALKAVFARKKMDTKLATMAQTKAERAPKSQYRFHEVVNSSFLPHYISMTQKQGVKLVLVRVKRRSVAELKPESKQLKKYIRDLSVYLEQHHVPLIDFTYDERITIEHYASGDHLNHSDGRWIFTQILARKLMPYFEN